MTYAEVVREYFPDASEDTIGFILWEKTGYPSFWRVGEDGSTIEECLRKQLKDFQMEVKDEKDKL